MADTIVRRLVTNRLLEWYRQNKRDLPWRNARDPYCIWISEIMLQQTQVVTVIPYYLRFITAFPNLHALADASLDNVLAVWRGLGYYSRARAVHRAAQLICEQYHGEIPPGYKELRALPGIGDYTAGAVLSIAFGQDFPAIDANARRVLCRLFDYAADPHLPEGKKAIADYALALLPPGQAGEFNQAMMELGAIICTAKIPRCASCPLAGDCIANRRGVQEERPLAVRRKSLPIRHFVSVVVKESSRILLVRRVPRGLLGGLWELPGGELLAGEDFATGIARIFLKDLNTAATIGAACGSLRHTYTHFTAAVTIYCCTIKGQPLPQQQWDSALWCLPNELDKYGLTGVTVKALAQVGYSLPNDSPSF
ncbi:MAG: A/G-specific adenine glycosylase [Chloroflexi bacterium]|nr:A/G-specific adenine glycosylase [Chloroflexota bacterium]